MSVTTYKMCLRSVSLFLFSQDIARYINITKGNYEGMRQIEEVEQSLEQYRGPSLTTYGNYHLDGELRIRSADGGTAKRYVHMSLHLLLLQMQYKL